MKYVFFRIGISKYFLIEYIKKTIKGIDKKGKEW